MEKGEHELAVPVGVGDHMLGPRGATITLVEYGDYERPECGAAYFVVRALQREMAGSMRFVFRNFPMRDLHPRAELAAYAAEAVAQQGQFWEMHDLLFEHQEQLSESSLLGYAYESGADVQEVMIAIATGDPRRRVESDVSGGAASGVTTAPAFFFNGRRYEGDVELESMYANAKALGPRSKGD